MFELFHFFSSLLPFRSVNVSGNTAFPGVFCGYNTVMESGEFFIPLFVVKTGSSTGSVAMLLPLW